MTSSASVTLVLTHLAADSAGANLHCCTLCRISGDSAGHIQNCCTFCRISTRLTLQRYRLLYFVQDFHQIDASAPPIVVFRAGFSQLRFGGLASLAIWLSGNLALFTLSLFTRVVSIFPCTSRKKEQAAVNLPQLTLLHSNPSDHRLSFQKFTGSISFVMTWKV